MAVWKCSHCGYTVDQTEPPEPCPSCGSECTFVDATCYTPECGGPEGGNINPDVGASKPKK
ncbi:rubredoxin-like domain-containing protein [Desulfohalobium retbaense]|uniref:Rubrerythrin rubredoxin-like domain-containing protein n=1 Tax=Desulfohalobium retbaense (strain ATCC 49708 / DSM 5692 / JCM 16813 / HR100) TaxID=485915 RepID=C8X195_DESRD|nr:hypothetical protein [Desulfohalobium retbaense]ACV68192.1 conserved hypothetical protein [Desulfohalobium retbaense DSM 5692]